MAAAETLLSIAVAASGIQGCPNRYAEQSIVVVLARDLLARVRARNLVAVIPADRMRSYESPLALARARIADMDPPPLPIAQAVRDLETAIARSDVAAADKAEGKLRGILGMNSAPRAIAAALRLGPEL